jgi:Uma2 family endonuclease
MSTLPRVLPLRRVQGAGGRGEEEGLHLVAETRGGTGRGELDTMTVVSTSVTSTGGSTMSAKPRATIEDLYKVEGKAELVNGEIVEMPPSGDEPNRASVSITMSLRQYERHTGQGWAYGDGTGFTVHLPHRESFSPDAAYHLGPRTGMRFLEGAPVFAVEVRSEHDYGPAAERAMREKRADYFACGTLVVWDVDLLSPDVIKSHKASDPDNPMIFRRSDIADAEPAVPGWRMAVDELFG